MPNRCTWIAVLLLVTAALLRVFAWHGEMSPDASVYAQYAWQLGHGQLDLSTDDKYIHRLPVYTPVALQYRAFGVSTASTQLWPLLCSLLQIAMAMLFARRWFGWGTALVAGLLLSCYPLDVLETARLMPDVPLAMLMGLAGLLWLDSTAEERGRAKWLALASGIALGLAAVVRLYAVILIAVFLVDAIFAPRRRLRLGMAALGFGGVGVLLLALYAVAAGNPLEPFQVVGDVYASGVLAEGARLSYYPAHLLPPWPATGVYPLLLLLTVALSTLQMESRRRRLLLWLAVLVVFLQLGSMSLSEYVPILKRTRFLTILSVPAAVFVASVLAGLAGWADERLAWMPRRRIWILLSRITVIASLALTSAMSVRVISRAGSFEAARADAYREICGELRAEPEQVVVVDHWRTTIRLAYYLGFEEGARSYEGAEDQLRMDPEHQPPESRFRYLSWYDSPEQIPPQALVIVDQEVLADSALLTDAERTFRESDIPSWAWPPSEHWDSLVDSAGLHLYRSTLVELRASE